MNQSQFVLKANTKAPEIVIEPPMKWVSLNLGELWQSGVARAVRGVKLFGQCSIENSYALEKGCLQEVCVSH